MGILHAKGRALNERGMSRLDDPTRWYCNTCPSATDVAPGDKTVQVAELREELSKRQLDTSGNKAELVERLTEAMAANDSPTKPEQPAETTEKKPSSAKKEGKKGKKQPAEAVEQPAVGVEIPTEPEQKPAAKKEAKQGKKRKNPEEPKVPEEAAAAKPVVEKTPGCKLYVTNLGKSAKVTEAKVKQLFGASPATRQAPRASPSHAPSVATSAAPELAPSAGPTYAPRQRAECISVHGSQHDAATRTHARVSSER